ncbi:MAG: hypothetical protein ACYDHH_33955 [Solirubrobacteraceae bacterium]
MPKRAKLLVPALLGITGAFVFGALASHVGGLIAAAGGFVLVWGLVIAADYRGVTAMLRASWPRSFASRPPDWQLRIIGWVFAVIGAVWMVAALLKTAG